MNKQYKKRRFSAILQKRIDAGLFEFPDGTLFQYMPISAYRMIERSIDDFSEVSIEDFRSHAERGIVPKNRGSKKKQGSVEYVNRPDYYGVSVFTSKEEMINRLHLPRENRKIAQGMVCCEGGPILPSQEDSHICWWIYDGYHIHTFKIQNEEETNE